MATVLLPFIMGMILDREVSYQWTQGWVVLMWIWQPWLLFHCLWCQCDLVTSSILCRKTGKEVYGIIVWFLGAREAISGWLSNLTRTLCTQTFWPTLPQLLYYMCPISFSIFWV